jgi:hypothetical protein
MVVQRLNGSLQQDTSPGLGTPHHLRLEQMVVCELTSSSHVTCKTHFLGSIFEGFTGTCVVTQQNNLEVSSESINLPTEMVVCELTSSNHQSDRSPHTTRQEPTHYKTGAHTLEVMLGVGVWCLLEGG